MAKIKVLVVDDSKLIREMFTEALSKDPEIEVIGSACDPYDARSKIKSLNPDVITLDIEMPEMDGISFLEKIMTLRPMPVVMVSTLTQKGADATIRALELGAVDCIGKPAANMNSQNMDSIFNELVTKVKMAAKANIRSKPVNNNNNQILTFKPSPKAEGRIIALGASTGGVDAIYHIVTRLPANTPPIAIVQHMPEKFTASFAARLNSLSQVTVQEAISDQELKVGNVYIAPGGRQMKIKKLGNKFITKVFDGDTVSGHRPSVDVLFSSVAKEAGNLAMGVILTGMGKDGAQGMLEMKSVGCYNIGEDESTAIVYGMPKAAKLIGAVNKEFPLPKIAEEILKHFS